MEFCQNQRLRFSPIEAGSYPRDRSDGEGDKGSDADEGKNQVLKYEGYNAASWNK
ncbi:MAG: hypothetical protein KDK60_02250 [Chlamydiia bacterium]|nr:hypothetical protein [Chlamydiia bacterium]